MAPVLPKGWPAGLPYLELPRLSTGLTAEQRAAVHLAGHAQPALPVVSPAKSRRTRILTISDPAHPACGQRGLAAGERLEPGAFVLAYCGVVHTASETDEASDYDLSLDRELGLGVDAQLSGNEARFVNDYRGVPGVDGPNCEFRDCWLRLAKPGEYLRAMGVFVLPAGKSGRRKTGVAKGDELLVSYGKGFWRGRLDEAGHVAVDENDGI